MVQKCYENPQQASNNIYCFTFFRIILFIILNMHLSHQTEYKVLYCGRPVCTESFKEVTNMSWENIPLLIILVLSVLGHNQSVAVATGFLLLIKLIGLNSWLPIVENHGINIGITILTIAILTPIATGRISMNDIIIALKSPVGIIALASGLFVAWTAGRGLLFINSSPEMISTIVLGTVIGVCFLQGVAIGPLIAGGLVSLAITFLNFFK